MDFDIDGAIKSHGWGILESDIFAEAMRQKHHYRTTVGEHTLKVAREAVRIGMLRFADDEKILKNIVVASLCHDLGMVGRKEKFRNNLQCLMLHPAESVKVYRNLTGESDARVMDAIYCHMFPLRLTAPKYEEGWILIRADKVASLSDIGGYGHI